MKKMAKKVETFIEVHFPTLLIATIAIVGLILIISTTTAKMGPKPPKVVYQPPEQLVGENFYPGRAYGDYMDLSFSFDAYLNDIGAKKVSRFMYTTAEGINQDLSFSFDGLDYTVKTVIFDTDCYTHGLYTSIRAENKHGVVYCVVAENCGTYIMDANSPLIMDREIFDLLHIATDKKSEYHRELQDGTDNSECPFRGFGIAHYEKWPDGTVIWHDDIGNFTVEDGLDLHY